MQKTAILADIYWAILSEIITILFIQSKVVLPKYSIVLRLFYYGRAMK